jgi:hypothetical protein
MWNLEQNAGPIAGLGIAPTGPAVREVEQNLDSLGYDFVTLMSANVGHEADPAGVVFLCRMVQALGAGRAAGIVRTRHRHFYLDIPCNMARAAIAAN